jgi:hypothetical protein
MTEFARPTPFALVFGPLAGDRFPVLQAGLARAGHNPRQRDAFLLVEEVAALLRELRPDQGLGEAVSALVGLVHAAYLYWADGERTSSVSAEALAQVLGAAPGAGAMDASKGKTRYVQLPPLRVWGSPAEGAPAEPLDGWFVMPGEGRLSVLAVFGLHPGRDGLTAVEVEGTRPEFLAREDGTPLFAPILPGAEAAGLASLIGQEELLELAWRLEALS